MAISCRFLRSALAVLGVLAAALAGPTACVQAAEMPSPRPALPTLEEFVRRVMNGDSNQLQGVYAPGLFADVVLQQPAGYPSFVSRDPQALTQYASASDLGSTGLLAHSFLAGRRFPLMRKGQIIHLIYGDGRIESFVVARLLRYRALQPNSVHSSFEDLAGGGRLDASTLFQRVYGHRGALVLQTCIEFDGSPNWGRLFVIAAPTEASEILPSLCPNCR